MNSYVRIRIKMYLVIKNNITNQWSKRIIFVSFENAIIIHLLLSNNILNYYEFLTQ